MSNSTPSTAVVITGASSGIGKATALYLAQHGIQVYAGVRKEADGQALLEATPTQNLAPVILDVTKHEQIAAAAQVVQDQLSAFDVLALVNNAGITTAGPVESLSIDELRYLWEVNVIGIVATTQAFLPLMRQVKRGHVVNISSFGGTISSPFLAPYHASKFALEALSDSLRMELAPWNIHVSVIKPASVKTPIWDKAVDDFESIYDRLQPGARELYGDKLEQVTKSRQAFDAKGKDPVTVAEEIYHTIIAEKPRTRKLLAFNPWVFAFLRFIPDRQRDKIVMRSLGL